MRSLAVAAATASLSVLALAMGPHAYAQDAATAAKDLQAIHDELRDNSPEAVVDRDSATFRQWLDTGLQQALSMTNLVNTPNAYGYVLKGYSGGFRDSSIEARPNWQPMARSFAIDWPGFSTSWRDGAYYVAYNRPGVRGLPPVGAKLIACDGIPAEQVARKRLDRYEGNLDNEADRVRTAPYLFWNRGNPLLGGHPLTCDFQQNGRGKRSIDLIYQISPDADREAAYRAAAPVGDGRFGVETWAPGHIWLTVHSLTEGADLDAFFTQLDSQLQAVRDAEVVVIDVRGAAGGAQPAGYRLANHLWDPDYVRMHWPPAQDVVFRTSQGNRDYFAGWAAQLKADPKYATDRATWDAEHLAEQIVVAFDAAIAAHQATFKLPPPPPEEAAAPTAAAGTAAAGAPPPPPPPPATNPMKGKVIILTDYACDTGCLQFMDLVTRLPNVSQAGNTTGTDTIFVSPTVKVTGSARITYPLQAWLDRPRNSNVAYTPQPAMTWTGPYNDDAGIKAWLEKAAGGAPAAPAAKP